MPRAIWTGSISFGLVNVPVKLFSATEQKDVHFHELDAKSGKRIRHQRVVEGTRKTVDYDEIVKGYEQTKGTYVIVTPEELEAVEPGQTRTIDIEDFVDLDEIDPVYFEKSYYLAPQGSGGSGGASRPYALLRDAMERSHKVAVGRFVLRTKQYLATIRPSGGVLVLETMFFPDEVRDPGELDIPRAKASPKELRIAEQLIDSLSRSWDPKRYHDTYRERVLELIEQKAKGKAIAFDEPEDKGAKVVDLMEALQASLERAKGAGGAKRAKTAKKTSGTKTSAKKKTPAKKAASRKAS